MRRGGRSCGLLLVVTVACLACGRDTPTGPTRPASALVGAWAGTIVDDSVGAGTLEIAIAEHVAISLAGSWTTTFAEPSLSDRGRLTGSVQEPSVTLTLESGTRTCGPLGPMFSGGPPIIGVTLRISGDGMTGSYFGFGCGPLRGGRVELTKR